MAMEEVFAMSEAEAAEAAAEAKKKKTPERDGVPLTDDLIRRKAEHNEGMLHNLEEIALHQLDIDKIECLNHCRCLKIVYLQCNLIRKIENLGRLKQLDYLNIAMNNITRIENLERCEALVKLDMTVNFVDLDELHSVGSLKNNTMLSELFLVGNPCVQYWESGYRDYVIATLPQLSRLDGTEITRTERIKAMQRLPELEKELRHLAPIAAERKKQQRARWEERQRKIDSGELVVTNETTDEWCPEVRVSDARELREIEEEKTAYRKKAQTETLFADQQPRERRFFKEDGTPIQMNTAKWPFAIDEDGLNVYVDVALPKFLDSAQVRLRACATCDACDSFRAVTKASICTSVRAFAVLTTLHLLQGIRARHPKRMPIICPYPCLAVRCPYALPRGHACARSRDAGGRGHPAHMGACHREEEHAAAAAAGGGAHRLVQREAIGHDRPPASHMPQAASGGELEGAAAKEAAAKGHLCPADRRRAARAARRAGEPAQRLGRHPRHRADGSGECRERRGGRGDQADPWPRL